MVARCLSSLPKEPRTPAGIKGVGIVLEIVFVG